MTTVYISDRPFPGVVNIVNKATFERRAYAPVMECRNLDVRGDRGFECSACGYEAETYGDSLCNPDDFEFCPMCGARVEVDR